MREGWAQYRCDTGGCGYMWTGPRYLLMEVRHRHLLKRHEAVAEAEALLQGKTLPASFKEATHTERECLCNLEAQDLTLIYDPECPVHGMEAVW